MNIDTSGLYERLAKETDKASTYIELLKTTRPGTSDHKKLVSLAKNTLAMLDFLKNEIDLCESRNIQNKKNK